MIFVKISQNFHQTSLKNLPSLTDFSPQLMACMRLSVKMAKSVQGEFELPEDTFGNFSKMLPLYITHIWQHLSTFIPETS